MKYELIKDLDDVRFKANTGVKKDTFLAMVLVLETAYAEAHKKLQAEEIIHREYAVGNLGILARIPVIRVYCGQLRINETEYV